MSSNYIEEEKQAERGPKDEKTKSHRRDPITKIEKDEFDFAELDDPIVPGVEEFVFPNVAEAPTAPNNSQDDTAKKEMAKAQK